MSSIIEKFEQPIESFPQIIEVKLEWRGGGATIVELPIEECFVAGNWLARRFSGVKFPKIEKSLIARGFEMYNVKFISVVTKLPRK